MLYQLANGKTIKITEEQFFKMSDLDFKDLEGSSYGYEINDPFTDSSLGMDQVQDLVEEFGIELDDSIIDPEFLEDSE